MIKVGVIGTHGTGKTIICHDLVSGLKKGDINAEYLGEVAREAKQKGFRLNEDTTPESQDWIFHTQYAKEIEIQELCPDVEILVCDRITFDNDLYRVNKFGYDPLRERVIDEHAKTYGLIFLVPLNGNYLKEDGVRATDRDFQRKMDELIRSELIRRQVPYHEFTGIDSAVEMILKMLEASNRNDTKSSTIR